MYVSVVNSFGGAAPFPAAPLAPVSPLLLRDTVVTSLPVVHPENIDVDHELPPEFDMEQIRALDLSALRNYDGNLTFLSHNMTWLLNISRELDIRTIDKFRRNRRVDDGAFYALIVVYSIVIVLGATGNSLVVVAVIRKPTMRTARNVFIINLAISDLLLCVVTMPLTLVELLSQYWPLGDTPVLCKLVGSLQATCVFVSTISITAIALDRYQVIVYPTSASIKTVGAVVMLLGIWVFAIILSLPNFIWRTLKHHPINLPDLDIHSVNFCFEEWPSEHGRGYYSVFVILFQYCLPIITVSIAYFRICMKLKGRMSVKSSAKKYKSDNRRMKKTNILLIAISLIFCLSWLPINIYNVVVDFCNPFGDDTESMLIGFAICHMMGMSSACSNPLLYGWLNDNFRKEFLEIFSLICPRCSPRPETTITLLQQPLQSHISRTPSPMLRNDHGMLTIPKQTEVTTTSFLGNDKSTGDPPYVTQLVKNTTHL
ncbi:unnamed protein product [Meganyctiphanes norvegica]|uniref:G-protein coupled receptors family 1 profile domain-containing protein n=1 Tax=Meganyctiphanes norvegica TaxID=48144 RepID=A0AAV2QV82_MEGNR